MSLTGMATNVAKKLSLACARVTTNLSHCPNRWALPHGHFARFAQLAGHWPPVLFWPSTEPAIAAVGPLPFAGLVVRAVWPNWLDQCGQSLRPIVEEEEMNRENYLLAFEAWVVGQE